MLVETVAEMKKTLRHHRKLQSSHRSHSHRMKRKTRALTVLHQDQLNMGQRDSTLTNLYTYSGLH